MDIVQCKDDIGQSVFRSYLTVWVVRAEVVAVLKKKKGINVILKIS